jgi:hypothetical protein
VRPPASTTHLDPNRQRAMFESTALAFDGAGLADHDGRKANADTLELLGRPVQRRARTGGCAGRGTPDGYTGRDTTRPRPVALRCVSMKDGQKTRSVIGRGQWYRFPIRENDAVSERRVNSRIKWRYGEMRERLKRVVLKTTEPGRVPGVRIPLSPPDFARLRRASSRQARGA